MGSLKPLQNRLDQHQTILLFQAAFALLKGSLKRLRYGNGKSGYGGDTPCSVSGCIDAWGSLKRLYWVSGCLGVAACYQNIAGYILDVAVPCECHA